MSYTLRDDAFEIDPFVDANLPYGWLYPVAAPVVADVVIVGGRRRPAAVTARRPKRYRLIAEPGRYTIRLFSVRFARRRRLPVAPARLVLAVHAARLSVARRVAAEAGRAGLVLSAVTLSRAAGVTAEPVALALTLLAVRLSRGTAVGPAPAALRLAAQARAARVVRRLSGAHVAAELGVGAATLARRVAARAGGGTLALHQRRARLPHARAMRADAGALSIQGADVLRTVVTVDIEGRRRARLRRIRAQDEADLLAGVFD